MTIMATKSRVIVQNEGTETSSEEDSEMEVESTEENPCKEAFDSDSNAELAEEDGDSDKESIDSEALKIDEEEEEDDTILNAGWADSISKILKTNKPKGKKTLVLSKAKKLTDVRRTKSKDAGFEVQALDGDVKRQQIEVPEDDKDEQPVKKKRKDLPNIRAKPNILQKDRERTLSKIATKGVVQLFNAVKKQQKDIDTKLQEAGPLEVKRDKVLKNMDKREFLNVLMGDKSRLADQSTKIEKVPETKKTQSQGSTWSVLRDDFMMGAKMKDWDKELENESEPEKEVIEESE